MMHHPPRTHATLAMLAALLLLSATAIAHDGVVFNPDRRADAPAYEPSRFDVLTEGFEDNFPPDGWERLNLGDTHQWERTSAFVHSGILSAYVEYGPVNSNQDEWLVTPALDLTGLVDVFLEFYEEGEYWAAWGDHHYVMVSTTSQTDPGAFTVIADMTPGDHTITGFEGMPVFIDLSDYAGQETVYVAMRYTGSNADNWYIDDMRVFQPWAHEVMVNSVGPDGIQYADGAVLPPSVTVANGGANAEDFDVQVTIWESGTEVYLETMTVTGLAPGAQQVVAFPGLTVNGGNFYDIHAVTLLATDEVSDNNEGTAAIDSYNQPHVPLGILLTQADCSGCPQANQALDAYMPGQGNDVALLRVHVWWPGVDILYDANTEQNDFLALGSGADYAPHLRIDQIIDAGGIGSGYASQFNARKSYGSPINIIHAWDPVTEMLLIDVENAAAMPADWILKLRVAFTEDNIYYAGGNGETIHNQCFRYMYPDTDGFLVPTTRGVHRFEVQCPVDTRWNYQNLRATVYVQNDETWQVYNSATAFLTELEDVTEVADHQAPAMLTVEGNHPNPFNPSTAIKYNLGIDSQVRLTVFDVDGRHVATLFEGLQTAGPQSVIWNGQDDAGRPMASGTYFFRVNAGEQTETRKMVMVK